MMNTCLKYALWENRHICGAIVCGKADSAVLYDIIKTRQLTCRMVCVAKIEAGRSICMVIVVIWQTQ